VHRLSYRARAPRSACAENLSGLVEAEPALEVFGLVRLEEERTGRTVHVPGAAQPLPRRTLPHVMAGPEVTRRGTERARQAPVHERAARAIEIATHVVASRTVQD
jgi:hypothetical protein